jgi:uncharacterized membrane protein
MNMNNRLFDMGLKPSQEKVDDRLIMLCDGVFAIAMTLLVLDISLDLKDGIDAAITALLGKLFIYIVTFLIIANYWSLHRHLMRIIKRMDSRLILITFLFLAFVTFFPVAFNMVTDNGHYAQVTILYALVVAGCGFSAQLLWFYASWKHRLIDPDLDQTEIRYRTFSGLSGPVIICLSLILLPLPFVAADPPRLFYSWLLIPVVDRINHVIYKRIQKKHAEEKGQEQQTLVSNNPAR